MSKINAIFSHTKKYWILILTGTLALTCLLGMLLFTNPFGFYVPRKIAAALAAAPFIFAGLSFLSTIISPFWEHSISRKNGLQLLLWSAAVAGALFFIFPVSRPLVDQPHQFKISATAEKNRYSAGSVVEVRRIRTLDGKTIPFDQLHLSGDWIVTDGVLISTQGGPASVVELSGNFAGGVVVSLRYLGEGGKAALSWDNQVKTVDLYTPSAPTIEDFVLDGFNPAALSPAELLLFTASSAGYFLGLFVVVMLFGLLVRSAWVQPKMARILLVLAYGLVLIAFILAKFSYYQFTGNRPYRDSRSYVQSADRPITSFAFWAGERSFTFPLELKLLNVHFSDNWSNAVMERVNLVQVWLSIASWGLLAFFTSLRVRQNWLRPLAFACILAYSLNLEIGIWDSLMLSESLSISFLALLVAGWMGWQLLADRRLPRWQQAALLVGLSLVSVLYSFARDSNLYFLVIAAALFLGKIILKRKDHPQKLANFVYIGILILIALLQNLSIAGGNRWQVFIYDHLSYRILPNPAARDFFAAHGLPISDTLMGITSMQGYQYQDMIHYDWKMRDVAEWVDQSGKQTYFLYLLNNLGDSLKEPIDQIPDLLDGTTLDYQFPIYRSRPFSPLMTTITRAFYFRSAFFEWLAGLTLLAGSIYWVFKGRHNSPWFVVLILAVSVYPMMFIVWHGEPMEIPRHAIQIGIQFRLAAWMAFILLLDALTIRIYSPQTSPSIKGASGADVKV